MVRGRVLELERLGFKPCSTFLLFTEDNKIITLGGLNELMYITQHTHALQDVAENQP